MTVEAAKLYTLPSQAPPLIGAALSTETAGWMGSWADGLVTISQPMDQLKKLIEAFRSGGGIGKPMYLKVQLSYAHDEHAAREGAYDQWRTNVLPGSLAAELWQVEQFDAAAEFVSSEDVAKMVHISSDFKKHIAWFEAYQQLGFERIILHNVNREQELFIQDFGTHVLPAFA